MLHSKSSAVSSSVPGLPSQVEDTAPSPGRIAVAISAFPYTASVAVRDIIDNSVEAGAQGVAVIFDEGDGKIQSVAIADDGAGVHPDVLNEVLRAGSRTEHLYSAQSLSRFGIGLKGAGFAVGKRIVVLTRMEGEALQRRAIDLEDIQRADRWLQEVRPPKPSEVKLFEELLGRLPGANGRETGTVVLLEKISLQTRDIAKLKTDLVRAVGETYGKFLAPVGGMAKLHVRIDDVDVEPIDPLHRENPQTLMLIKREEIALSDGSSLFFTAVALPHPNSVSEEVKRKYRYTQKDQGFYVYRNGRLVMGGQTLGLFGNDFHLNAFRAELDYTTSADEHVRVDVAKSTVILSEEAANKLKSHITTATRTAATLWREKDVLTPDDIQGLFDESNRLIASRHKLLVDALKKRKASLGTRKKRPGPAGDKPGAKEHTLNGAYLRPVPSLPEDVLYRPLLDGELGGLVVEVNLAHPFAKALFEVPVGEGKKAVPRRATTAIQQLLYVLGYCEDGLSDDEQQREVFEQFRRYVSMNLRALLAD